MNHEVAFKKGDRVTTKDKGTGTVGHFEHFLPNGKITTREDQQGDGRIEVILDDPTKWVFDTKVWGDPYFFPRDLALIEVLSDGS